MCQPQPRLQFTLVFREPPEWSHWRAVCENSRLSVCESRKVVGFHAPFSLNSGKSVHEVLPLGRLVLPRGCLEPFQAFTERFSRQKGLPTPPETGSSFLVLQNKLVHYLQITGLPVPSATIPSESETTMCGRFTLKTPAPTLLSHFGLTDMPELPPRYNIAPTQPIATVLVLTGDREFRLMRWGLVPSWAKDLSIGNRMINARAETVAEKTSFKKALKERRCLIMADGFYEWDQKGKVKQPYHIVRKDNTPLAFAGLWDRWQSPEGEPVESCTIITTTANDVVGAFHERMPVILEPSDYDLWLNVEIHDPNELLPLLKPYPSESMVAYPVSTLVNSPANDHPDCLKPVDEP